MSTHFAKCKKRRTLTKTPTFIGELELLDDESVVRPVRLFAEASRHVDFLPVVLQPIDRQCVLGVPDDLAGYLQSLANPCRHVLWTDVDGRGGDHLQAAAGREKIGGEMMVKVLIGLRPFLKKWVDISAKESYLCANLSQLNSVTYTLSTEPSSFLAVHL